MINEKLIDRCQNLCELCGLSAPTHEHIVIDDIGFDLNNIVGLCDLCFNQIEPENNKDSSHWQCLAASIWSDVLPVQILSYRVLYLLRAEDWASDIINSVDIGDSVIESAIRKYKIKEVHKDAYGSILENGDNVVLTQVLNVKGANFMAPKGTIVKKIKLVPENTTQIEGKINDQTIVILTQFVKKA